MSKYEFTNEMGEISGFGGDYEQACRKMVIAGVEYLEKNKNIDFSFKEYENIYGILAETSEDTDKIIKAMIAANDDFGATGGMVQATLNHVKFIYEKGWNKYVETMIKDKQEDEKVEEPVCEEVDNSPQTFEEDLRKLINSHSVENRSGTPDFILATYILDCLDAFGRAAKRRDQWFGNTPIPDTCCAEEQKPETHNEYLNHPDFQR